MKNFIFKSEADFHKIVFNKLDIIQSELRHARVDHVKVLMLLEKMQTDQALQKQVDEYFDEADRATAGLVQDPVDPE